MAVAAITTMRSNNHDTYPVDTASSRQLTQNLGFLRFRTAPMSTQVIRVQSPVLVLVKAVLFNIRIIWTDSLSTIAARFEFVEHNKEEMDGGVRTNGIEEVGHVGGPKGFGFGIPYGYYSHSLTCW